MIANVAKRRGATLRSEMMANETNQRVLALLKREGAMCLPNVAKALDLHRATVQSAFLRLLAGGYIRKIPGATVHVGHRGHVAQLYEIDDSGLLSQVTVKSWAGSHTQRHPQDVALFGEYQRAA